MEGLCEPKLCKVPVTDYANKEERHVTFFRGLLFKNEFSRGLTKIVTLILTGVSH